MGHVFDLPAGPQRQSGEDIEQVGVWINAMAAAGTIGGHDAGGKLDLDIGGSSLFPVGESQENRLARKRRDAEN